MIGRRQPLFPDLDPRVMWTLVAPEEASRALEEGPEGWLAPGEQALFAGLSSEGRRREWCVGRLAAKRVTARWLEQSRGVLVSPPDVAIGQDERGAPYVVLPAGAEAPSISLAHSDGHGFAALAPPEMGIRVGVDLERLRDISPRLLRRLLAPGETGSATVQPPGAKVLDGVTLWTLKEATLKALGIGLRQPMRTLAVTVTAPGRVLICRVEGPPNLDDYPASPWTAEGSHARAGGFVLAVVVVRHDGRAPND